MNRHEPPLEAAIRKIRPEELSALLELYRHLHTDDVTLVVNGDLERLWQRILADPQLHYFVAEVDGKIVSSCTLAIILNLTRGARPFGLIENVVTYAGFRKKGLGTRVLQAALNLAWEHGCYKVMLLTGRKDPGTLRFYKRAGFEGGIKTGFVAKRK